MEREHYLQCCHHHPCKNQHEENFEVHDGEGRTSCGEHSICDGVRVEEILQNTRRVTSCSLVQGEARFGCLTLDYMLGRQGIHARSEKIYA